MKISIATISLILINVSFALAQQSDAALRRALRLDADQRTSAGKLPTLEAAEHLSRADTYMANRLFPEARAHWQKVLEHYPDDPGVSRALFGMGRSHMWERQYDKAVDWFEKLNGEHLSTKEGREGLAFRGASLVRLGKNLEAARVYEQYATAFPNGERIESSYLNIIDAYREAGEYQRADDWITRTVERFPGKPSEVNALHARLRLAINRERWSDAVRTADTLLAGKSFTGAMAGSDEIKFLRAFALEKAGRKSESRTGYAAVGRGPKSYFGELADNKLGNGSDALGGSASEYKAHPVMFRADILREARKHKIDPRFLLAIMKQESSFRAAAKSPAGARGLLQLVYDTAIKYNQKAGYSKLQPDQLYSPAVNVAVGAAYIADLKSQFGGLYEAIAASYNGGEDNAARWLNRSKPKDAGIFVSEIGFAETKNYVFKVMNNYRAYRNLYTEGLERR